MRQTASLSTVDVMCMHTHSTWGPRFWM